MELFDVIKGFVFIQACTDISFFIFVNTAIFSMLILTILFILHVLIKTDSDPVTQCYYRNIMIYWNAYHFLNTVYVSVMSLYYFYLCLIIYAVVIILWKWSFDIITLLSLMSYCLKINNLCSP